MLTIQENVPLAPLTSFRIGGEALFYVEINLVDDLKEALAFAKEKNIPYYVLGGGTNLLISDAGFKGLILRMKMNGITVTDTTMEVEAGVPLIKAVNSAAAAGLSGIESLAGIPGTFGGAVRGNAGAFGSETGNVIDRVKAFDTTDGEVKFFAHDECDFAYRMSVFKKNPHLIVLSATVNLLESTPEEVQQKSKETIAHRIAKELQGVKSAGSYFMNPVVEDQTLCKRFEDEKGVPVRNCKLPAGWVIDQVDLRGKKIGGAMISEKHANYIVNDDNATADDVMMLVSYTKQQVRDKLGIQLQEEVNYLGF